ncbi:MAG TPA: hypothetical protein VH740_24135 [Vicinamibacterales bacterium]|jgi:hypothetical protein
MLCGLVLALVTALARPNAAESLTLEVRVFNGAEEVTSRTRLTVHRAGDRRESLPHTTTGDGRVQLVVPAGIYDVQAIEERDGRVVNIRWANRLVVMPYPDEQGHHLEVINFKNGFGALQVRKRTGGLPDVALFEPGKRHKPIGGPFAGPSYMLFIVPASTYDLRVRSGEQITWQNGIEVPLDRTRLAIIE